MADLKTTQLDADTAPTTDDLIMVINDPGGSPANKKVTIANLVASIFGNGWISADETWTYASADDPTYTFTISGDLTGKYSVGMRVKLTQTTVRYFIITKVVEAAGTTTITIYGGTDYDLDNDTITLPYYSIVKAPFGFPLDTTKWTVELKDTTYRYHDTPTENVWYYLSPMTIDIPIGLWRVYYSVSLTGNRSTAGDVDTHVTLSTANDSESDADFTMTNRHNPLVILSTPGSVEKFLSLAAKTTYYMNVMTSLTGASSIMIRNDWQPGIIRAICAYL